MITLIVIDGFGIAKPGPGNCISLAKTPNYDFYWKNYPHTKLHASGEHVGSVKGAQGTSEVGHLHMGAGRIVLQPLPRINSEIKSDRFSSNKMIKSAMNAQRLHLIGLCSDGGVHSHIDHLVALLKIAKRRKIKDVFIHIFADGRDVPEQSVKKYIKRIQSESKRLKTGKISSIVGRYYAMDRDKNYSRTKVAYDLLTRGKGKYFEDPIKAIDFSYASAIKTDYYIKPVITERDGIIRNGDSCIFFNYRTDRARQLTYPFVKNGFKEFKRTKPKVNFYCFSDYDKSLPLNVIFPQLEVKDNLGETLSKNGIKQLRIAETEKYAHVTYFFNSQVEKPVKGEKRIMVPSLKVKSYDKKPQMSAKKIVNVALSEIKSGKYGFTLINFANCDLVGHSANIPAIKKAVECVDECLKRVVDATLSVGGTAIITADHGSAEEKLYKDGRPKPSHTTNPVPFIIVSDGPKVKLKSGGLSDIAPTITHLLGVKKPSKMTGKSLIMA